MATWFSTEEIQKRKNAIKSVESLCAYTAIKIQNDSVKEIYDYIAKTMQENIKKDVYNAGFPTTYTRREDKNNSGGLMTTMDLVGIKGLSIPLPKGKFSPRLDTIYDEDSSDYDPKKYGYGGAINGFSKLMVKDQCIIDYLYISNFSFATGGMYKDGSDFAPLSTMLNNGYGQRDKWYNKPRPFMTDTINDLKENKIIEIYKKNIQKSRPVTVTIGNSIKKEVR